MGEGEAMEWTVVVPEEPSERRRTQFTIRGLLLVPILMVIFVGLAATIDNVADTICLLSIGDAWFLEIQYWLIGAGVPASFVTKYVPFALLRLPEWIVLAVAALTLGLQRSRRSRLLAWLLILSFPLSEAIADSWHTSSGDIPGIDLLMSFRIRIVSAFGLLVGIIPWFLGWWIRGRHYDDTAERRTTRVSRSVQIVVWTLVLIGSGSGWAALARLK